MQNTKVLKIRENEKKYEDIFYQVITSIELFLYYFFFKFSVLDSRG